MKTRLHLGEIQRILKEFEPICICLQHVGSPVQTIGKYHLATSSIPEKGALGTAIYVHHKITFDKIVSHSNYLQNSVIKLYLSENRTITLCNIYNQPNQQYNLNQLQNFLSFLPQPILLVGDFNAHHPIWNINIKGSDNGGEQIEHLLLNHNYCCLNEEDSPTYFSRTHGTFSSVDLSLCSSSIVDIFEWHVLNDNYTSDHYPIIISHLDKCPPPQLPKYNFDRADWEKYNRITENIKEFQNTKGHEEINNYFTEFIINAANESIPLISYSSSKRTVPWWSEDLSQKIKLKHSLNRRLDRLNNRFKNIINKTENKINLHNLVLISLEIECVKPVLNKISAIVRRDILQNRKQSWCNYVNNFSEISSQQKLWKKFRKINGSFSISPRSPILYNNHKIHNPKDISNIIGRHLESIGNSLNMNTYFQTKKFNTEKIIINFETSQELVYNNPFTEAEFEMALESCNNSAPGKDNVSFVMIKKLNIKAKKYLLKFYNYLWKMGFFPKLWRHAIIIPIVKPGKDPSLPTNYRPISLTSSICKLMEKMVNMRLMWYIEENNILSPTQSGARRNRSTLDSLGSLENQIKEGFLLKKITVAVFFDIEKAYDTTWRYSILQSLYNCKLRGALPIFIQNFLKNRTFQTRIETTYSETFSINEGIPQGSVLSGTLFALAINDITKCLPNGVNNSLYVDDFAIFYTSGSLRHIQRIMNKAIKNIEEWTSSVGYKLSVEKTKAIVFYKDKRWLKNQNIDLSIKNTSINFMESVKFLGLHFDQRLNWKVHVKQVKAKGLKALNICKKLAHTTWGADRETMLKLYKATVLPILEYGSQIYASASEPVLRTLDPVHHLGLRLATGAFRSSPTSSLIVDSGDLPLHYRFEISTMRRAIKIKEGPSPIKKLFVERDKFLNSKIRPPFPVRAKRLWQNNDIAYNSVYTFHCDIAPWNLKKPHICLKLSNSDNRKTIDPRVLKQQALAHMQCHNNLHPIYTDGSKSELGVGFAVVSRNFKVLSSLPKYATVYTAELFAIKNALIYILRHNIKNIVIYSDSLSALEAINSYSFEHSIIKEIKVLLNKLIDKRITVVLCWIPSHIGLKGNEEADKCAKESISTSCIETKVPFNDILANIKSKMWQKEWEDFPVTNKLRSVKQSVSSWPSSVQKNRHLEVILTRLRIGHTRLTHGHLMSSPHGNPPVCDMCQCQLTIKHLFIDCPKYQHQRRIFKETSLKSILAENENFSLYDILSFLKQISLFNKI